ncbi:MAG TPA: L,D-transpeptidase family protein [Mycobacteriales bacterium]|nr:L,D-transpeptidase family protein [Mycobacteriales bacterium]
MPRRRSIAALVTACALLAGCTADAARPVAVVAPDPVPSSAPAELLTPPVAEPSESELSESPSPSPSRAKRKPAPPTYDVVAVQKQLAALLYYIGPINGRPGAAQRSSVMAFQKVQGIQADGSVGKATLAALKAPKKPVLKGNAPANRVEVDLTKQVLYVVRNGAIVRIMPVSSGNGKTYEQKDGGTARALSPVGYYKIQRRIIGERKADLGTLYDPQYFYKGWAIHGSNSVPARPASHGCIRVTRADAKYLLDAINVGMSVYIYGGTHTFTAGSSAPGTDSPTGDTPQDTASPSPSPSPAASSSQPAPSSSPSSSPAPALPTPGPTGSSSPSPSAVSASPTP